MLGRAVRVEATCLFKLLLKIDPIRYAFVLVLVAVVDESYMGPFKDDPTRSDHDMEFIGGYPGDPDFVCSIRQNGNVVTFSQVVP
jgi:hypothetical protein